MSGVAQKVARSAEPAPSRNARAERNPIPRLSSKEATQTHGSALVTGVLPQPAIEIFY
jgi:hypothetical protein